MGILNRTIQFIKNGIKPIWVFDGAPPELKLDELKKRKELKIAAKEAASEAKEVGKVEDVL